MILFRKFGNFYSVFDDDAIILHSLFQYKIKDGRVGFPINSINKILDKLNELHIDYKVGDKEMHFEDNKYKIYLTDAKNKIFLDYKITEIENKISYLEYNELNELIGIIDNYIDERR